MRQRSLRARLAAHTHIRQIFKVDHGAACQVFFHLICEDLAVRSNHAGENRRVITSARSDVNRGLPWLRIERRETHRMENRLPVVNSAFRRECDRTIPIEERDIVGWSFYISDECRELPWCGSNKSLPRRHRKCIEESAGRHSSLCSDQFSEEPAMHLRAIHFGSAHPHFATKVAIDEHGVAGRQEKGGYPPPEPYSKAISRSGGVVNRQTPAGVRDRRQHGRVEGENGASQKEGDKYGRTQKSRKVFRRPHVEP